MTIFKESRPINSEERNIQQTQPKETPPSMQPTGTKLTTTMKAVMTKASVLRLVQNIQKQLVIITEDNEVALTEEEIEFFSKILFLKVTKKTND